MQVLSKMKKPLWNEKQTNEKAHIGQIVKRQIAKQNRHLHTLRCDCVVEKCRFVPSYCLCFDLQQVRTQKKRGNRNLPFPRVEVFALPFFLKAATRNPR